MLTRSGGQKVGSGTYWDISSGLRIDMEQEGVLPGDESAKYLKASAGMILLAGPFLGLVYIIVLPIMGVVTALSLLLRKMLGSVADLARNIVSFGWRPSESYLGGKNKKKSDAESSDKPSPKQ